ncbi:TBC1 domain family member 17-like isoform X1 [Juglans microcarpa x Juglans regia]|uniref:TBC1 domain family member 17-like isoform X1 n=1 Tax=Juglans microcarpa x Juglans regia TaxID=2249226 RepID=UPI001B7DEECB|nr:TBC1 domain family member 17-like isoform X1 [Juglans microcarpa x Juglans regia]
MQETDLHDLSDDADYAASQLQGSASMMGSDSRTQSSSSEPDGAEIVYMKDNVTIHPTQFASERISGRLKLIKQGYTLFMTWIPYKGQSSNAKLSEKDRNLYTIRAVPFTEVRSIRRHTPALGWQYIIVVLSSGLAYPPLYFYNGGVKEFLGSIKQHVFIVRSAEDANVFLVNDFQNPLQKTLSSLELPRAVSVVSEPSMSVSVGESPLNDNQEITDAGVRSETSSVSQYNVKQRQKGHDPARDLSIQVLEKFSLVTKFARETTSQIFRESHGNGFGAIERRSHNHSALDSAQKASNIAEKVPDTIPVASDPLEKISYMKHNLVEEAATNLGTFELINCKEVDKLTLVWGKPRQPPLGPEEWFTFLDSEGRVMDSKALRKRIFYGGLEHGLRKEAWAFVLGYHLYDSTYAERQYLRLIKKSEYETIKRQWQSISSEQAKRFTKFRERKGLIEKDVVRTDRSLSFYDGEDNANVNLLRDILLTYSFYNFDLGYCQGMSDLLSPILFVMEDESESFWCFVALMERLGPNFNRDQNGMHSQLFALSKLVELLDSPLHNYFEQNDCLNYFFCFRWILIQLKREFEYEKTMRLWEVLWTHYLSEHFHLYVCVAILKRYRNRIMGEQMDFDTLLKFINELSGHIDLDSVLRDAEALCICAGENGAACIPPGTPPSLPVEDGLLYTEQDDVL